MSKEAMKLALEALKQIDEAMPFPVAKLAQAALREALAEQPAQQVVDCHATGVCVQSGLRAEQPAQQEPFGYFKAEPFGWTDCAETDEGAVALYERPAQRTWVGLTNNELQPIADEYRILFGGWVEDFARAIEAKLQEKNT